MEACLIRYDSIGHIHTVYASECVRVNRQLFQALPLHHSLMVDPTPSSNTTFPSLTVIIACVYTHTEYTHSPPHYFSALKERGKKPDFHEYF